MSRQPAGKCHCNAWLGVALTSLVLVVGCSKQAEPSVADQSNLGLSQFGFVERLGDFTNAVQVGTPSEKIIAEFGPPTTRDAYKEGIEYWKYGIIPHEVEVDSPLYQCTRIGISLTITNGFVAQWGWIETTSMRGSSSPPQ